MAYKGNIREVRHMLKKFLVVASLLLAASAVATLWPDKSVFAQNVQQSGTVTARHIPYWVSSGVIADGGSATDSPISSIGVTNNGGAGFCVSSDRQTAAGRNQLCFGASTTGPATISLQNYGTASAQSLQFVLNGVTSTPVFATVGTPAIGNLSSFAGPNTLQDSGISVSSATFTNGTWNGNPIGVLYGGTGANNAGAARNNLGLGTMAVQNSTNVSITGGAITGLPTPTNPSDAAIKSYVDSTATGLTILAPSRLATATVLPNSPTYANGTAGVGATLTAGSNTTLTVDGSVANLNDVILVKNQASAFQNGIYILTTAGGGVPWVLTRATYFDQSAEMKAGSYTFITTGTANINSSWTLQTTITTVGTDSVNFVQFSQTGGSVTSVATTGFITGGTITTTGTINGSFVPSIAATFGASF